MLNGSVQFNEFDSFKQANALLKNPLGDSFAEMLEQTIETKAKETANNTRDKASEAVEDASEAKKKKAKETSTDKLSDITKITKNNDKDSSKEVKNTYMLLDQMREKKKAFDNEPKSPRQQLMENPNFAGQAAFQPVADQGQRKATKSQMLAAWEKFAPTITEDLTRKAVRIDIPLINDIQALVLRMNPDKSITASMLGSFEMGELVKQHKDKLDKNLRHHHLSLKEFNTYRSELEFTSESGTRKSKKKPTKQNKKQTVDLM